MTHHRLLACLPAGAVAVGEAGWIHAGCGRVLLDGHAFAHIGLANLRLLLVLLLLNLVLVCCL